MSTPLHDSCIAREAQRAMLLIDNKLKRIRGGYLSTFVYKLINRLWNKSSSLPSTDDAGKLLEELNPDPRTSCITRNQVLESETDLQIIIPVYNVEQYVESCLESILNQQTKYNYHIVVINDGSTDKSRQIISKYESDPRVSIIDQSNRGFSGARNSGLRKIKAKYLMFVDSDDKVSPIAIDSLLDAAYATDADIVQGGYDIIVNGSIVPGRRPEENNDVDPIQLFGYPWGKVYKARLWENFQFPENYWFEDTIMTMIIHKTISKAATIPQIVYLYRANPNGISVKMRGKAKVIDTLWIMRSLLKDAQQLGMLSDRHKVRQHLITFCRQAYMAYMRSRDLSDEIRKAVFVELHHIRDTYLSLGVLPENHKFIPYLKAIDDLDYPTYARLSFLKELF